MGVEKPAPTWPTTHFTSNMREDKPSLANMCFSLRIPIIKPVWQSFGKYEMKYTLYCYLLSKEKSPQKVFPSCDPWTLYSLNVTEFFLTNLCVIFYSTIFQW